MFLDKTDINVEGGGARWTDEWQFKIQISRRAHEMLMENDPPVWEKQRRGEYN